MVIRPALRTPFVTSSVAADVEDDLARDFHREQPPRYAGDHLVVSSMLADEAKSLTYYDPSHDG